MLQREWLAIFLSVYRVDDLEVFDVIVEVGPEGQLDSEELFHADEQLGILAAKALEDRGMHQHTQTIFFAVIAQLESAHDRAEFALELDRHCRGALYNPAATAIGTIGV